MDFTQGQCHDLQGLCLMQRLVSQFFIRLEERLPAILVACEQLDLFGIIFLQKIKRKYSLCLTLVKINLKCNSLSNFQNNVKLASSTKSSIFFISLLRQGKRSKSALVTLDKFSFPKTLEINSPVSIIETKSTP